MSQGSVAIPSVQPVGTPHVATVRVSVTTCFALPHSLAVTRPTTVYSLGVVPNASTVVEGSPVSESLGRPVAACTRQVEPARSVVVSHLVVAAAHRDDG